ncbi:MAG: hypothetical protein LBL86_02050 [Coriobacteriales bacterium]|jgi:hypothetical protein|nr:hypothetical protein [Coriobacteriales bacterium]
MATSKAAKIAAATARQKYNKLVRYRDDINDDLGSLDNINSEVDALRDDVNRLSDILGGKMWGVAGELYESSGDSDLYEATCHIQKEIDALSKEMK